MTGVRLVARAVEFFSSPPRPDRLWGLFNLLSMGTERFLPGGNMAGAWRWLLTSS